MKTQNTGEDYRVYIASEEVQNAIEESCAAEEFTVATMRNRKLIESPELREWLVGYEDAVLARQDKEHSVTVDFSAEYIRRTR